MKRFNIGYHARVMLSGCLNALYGAATAGLVGISAYGFTAIPLEDGYIAVCDFIGSVATLVVALTCMYAWGKGVCRKNKHEKEGVRMSNRK